MKATIQKHLNSRKDLPEAEGWVKVLGRIGLTAMGVVYLVIGILALRVAFDAGGELTNARGALQTIAQQPFGQTLLVIVGLGLLAYAIYRLLAAWKDIDALGKNAKGIVGRLGLAISGLVYGAIGVGALGIPLAAGGSSGGGSSKKAITAELMNQPFGQWLVGIIGGIVVGYAVYQGIKAYEHKFLMKFKTSEMSGRELRAVDRTGVIGLMARAVVMAIIGWFLIHAALQRDPGEAGGLAKSMAYIASQPFGQWLLGAVAAGLFLFGIYAFFLARYRHFARARA